MLNSCESSLLKPACNLYNPLSMMFLFFVVLFAKVASSGQNRPNAGKSWDSWSAFYTTGSYKPPVNAITRCEMKTLSVRERIEIKLLGRQRLFKRNSYQIRRNEYSKDNVRLRASHGWLFPDCLKGGVRVLRKVTRIIHTYIHTYTHTHIHTSDTYIHVLFIWSLIQ